MIYIFFVCATAEKLGTTPEGLISNILLKKLKELEGKIEKKRK